MTAGNLWREKTDWKPSGHDAYFCDTHVHFVYNKEDEQPVDKKKPKAFKSRMMRQQRQHPKNANGYYRFYSGTACGHWSEMVTFLMNSPGQFNG
jgi:hypothetical protein